jgi:hypothetical protein
MERQSRYQEITHHHKNPLRFACAALNFASSNHI